MTIGPLLGFGVILLVVIAVWGRQFAAWLLGAGLGSYLGPGKFVILGGLFRGLVADMLGFVPQTEPPSPTVLAGVVVYAEVGTALFMMANMTVLYRVPWLGARLAAAHEADWYVLRVHPWMRRMAELGVALFVALPFQGTGAVMGTVLGRVLGLTRTATLCCVAAGSAAGCLVLAQMGDVLGDRLHQIAGHPLATAIALAVAIAALIVAGRWFMGQSASNGDAD